MEEDLEMLDIRTLNQSHQIKTPVPLDLQQQVLLHQIMLVLAVVVDKGMDHHHQEEVLQGH